MAEIKKDDAQQPKAGEIHEQDLDKAVGGGISKPLGVIDGSSNTRTPSIRDGMSHIVDGSSNT